MHIGSRVRDRLGMLCATGAVACLASFTVQWSGELPVHRSPWEQELFGDLSTPAAPDALPASPAAVSPKLEQSVNLPSLAEPIPLADMPDLAAVPSPAVEVLPAAGLDRSAAEVSPRIIQPVRHQQPDDSPTAWLSGGIELLDDASPPTSQSGTRYFPEAHRGAARHQDLCR